MSHDVFISHASADRNAAVEICIALEQRGLRCWIAPRNVLPGEDWGMAILAAIAAARCMVVVVSGGTHDSVHVKNEVITATSQRLPIVPVRVADIQPGGALRLHLAAWHWLDAFPPPAGQHGDALATGVRASFADLDATVNMNLRRMPMPGAPPAPMPPRMVAAAPAPRPAAPIPMPPDEPPTLVLGRPMAVPPSAPTPPPASARRAPAAAPAAARATPATAMPATPPAKRSPALALAVIGGTLALAIGLVTWFVVFGPGLTWAFGTAEAPVSAPTPTASAAPAEAPALRPVAAIDPPPAAPAAPETPPRVAQAAPGTGPDQPASPPPTIAPAGPAAAGAQPRPLDTPAPPVAPPVAAARPATVTIINAAGQDIDRLYISPVADNRWGEDWLGMAQITPGNRVLAPRPPEQGCLYDMRVVYRDRRVEELRRQDLCARTEWRFDASKARAAEGAAR